MKCLTNSTLYNILIKNFIFKARFVVGFPEPGTDLSLSLPSPRQSLNVTSPVPDIRTCHGNFKLDPGAQNFLSGALCSKCQNIHQVRK